MTHFFAQRAKLRGQLASKRRFFATLEQLERRDLLAAFLENPTKLIPSTAIKNGGAACDCSCTCSRQTGQADNNDGTYNLPAATTPLVEAKSFLPAYSTRSLRDVIVSADLLVFASPPDMVAVETTFNSGTGSPVYFDTSGLSYADEVRISDRVDISSLSPGRYPYTMDFTEYTSGIPGSTFSSDDYVLVGSTGNALLSPGWYLPGLDRLTVTVDGALWETGAGEMYWFDEAGGNYYPTAGNEDFRTLTDNLDGTFTLSSRFGEEMDFNSLGLVSEQRDRFGQALLAFSYLDADSDSDADDIDEIETRDGRILSFGYTAGFITSITDFDGRVVTLGYDVNDQLESVTYPDPDDTGPLDPLVIAYTYATGTSFLETIDEAGDTTTLAYGFADDVISRENQDGEFDEFAAYLVQSLVDPGSGFGTFLNPAPIPEIVNLGATREDALGNTTTYVFGYFGNPETIVDAYGKITTLEYDADGRLETLTAPDPDDGGPLGSPQHIYAYTGGNLTFEQLPNSGQRNWTYDATWNVPDSYENELGLLTLYEINSGTGLVDSIREVVGNVDDGINLETDDHVTELTYTAAPTGPTDPPQGLVETITDAEGRITVFVYNARGNPTSITYADGTADEATVNIHYGALGPPDYIDDELNRRTNLYYDDLGRLTSMLAPDPDGKGSLARPEYKWEHDELSRVVTETDPLDRDTITTFDQRGRPSKVELPDHDGDKSLTTFLTDYYETGETKTTTNPLGFETLREYDKLRRGSVCYCL